MKKNKKTKKDRKKIKDLFYKIVSILLLIVSAVLEGILLYIDLLPTKYLVIVSIALILFVGLNVLLLNIKKIKKKIKKVVSIVSIIATILMILANFYIYKTLGVLINNGDSKYKLEHYSVIVLESSDYDKIKDIRGETIGYFKNSIGAEEANKTLEKKIDIEYENYESANTLMEDLMNSKINVILVEDSVKEIMEEESKTFAKSTKTIYTFTIKVKVESTLKDVNVTKEPFAIYLSGIDTYGEISSVSRSDVNMVIVVNPNTNQMLLISIPRDFYVQLHGTTGTKDKLTHAGIYGIDMSIQTIEDLLDVKINYYFKVNFTSVIDIVDALGGLDVYSEYSFISYSGYSFKEGLNSVDGKQALDFVRTRKAFVDGDRQRGKNQQALIEAMVRKATDKSIITKYNSLLNAINGKYQTNMSIKKITSLIKMQLETMPSWNITSYSLTGTDSSNYTYTYYQLLYVMEPDQESVSTAIQMIDAVLEGQVLDSSYKTVSGESNKVTQVTTKKKQSTKKEESSKLQKEETNQKQDEPKKYTITFNSNEGSYVANQIIEEGESVIEPEIPIREGYEFIGWFINEQEYNFDSTVEKNMTLTAKWEKDQIQIDNNVNNDIKPEEEIEQEENPKSETKEDSGNTEIDNNIDSENNTIIDNSIEADDNKETVE